MLHCLTIPACAVALCAAAASASAAVSVTLYQPPRTQFVRGEHIPLHVGSGALGGRVSLAAESEGRSVVVWDAENDRLTHPLRLPTDRLRCGQYRLTASVTRDGITDTSKPLEVGVNPPFDDALPIFTFAIGKHNIPKTLEGYQELVRRFRAGGYNQLYFFHAHEAVVGNGLATGSENKQLLEFMEECTRLGMGLVPMTNTFLYGLLDDETSSVAASGNFPSTYVHQGGARRMISVRHPRHVEAVQDRLRSLLVFLKQWPCIRGLDVDDEPTASFYNVFGAGRVDKAPEGEKWWGNGDYNPHNVALFRERYGVEPPRYASAAEVQAKYPPGSVVSRKDPWFQWLEFTGKTLGDYYAAIVPTAKEVAPGIPVFTQPFLGLAGAFWGVEYQSFHAPLDRVNYHYIAGGHPVEGAAAAAILGHSVRGKKPILAMVHTANFGAVSTPEVNVYNPAYVMQQFWSCIGVGVKGIGEQGEFDVSQRKDTWEHWTKGAHDVAAIAPLLLKADRPKSRVAILYSVESEWMHAAYRDHPLQIWRQHHTFDLLQAALQRANIPYDVVTTADLGHDPRALDSYQAVLAAALDYALEDVHRILSKAGARLYVTPDSALKPPRARRLAHRFDEVYRLFNDAGVRDPRTYDHLIDERADYLRTLLKAVPLDADASSSDTLVYLLDAPGCQLVTPVNCSLNWMFAEDPSPEAMAKVRAIVGANAPIPTGRVDAKEIQAEVSVRRGRFAYDLRAHAEVPVRRSAGGLSFARRLEGGEGTVVAVTPTRLGALQVEPLPASPGFRVKALDDAGKPLSWALPIRVEVLQPDGKPALDYASYQVVERGVYEGRWTWALNDPAGDWTVRITDLASGKTAQATLANGK